MKQISTKLLILSISVFSGLVFGGTLAEVDFDSMTTGTATPAGLNAATTGGTWTTNAITGTSLGVVHEIENDGGDKAFSSKFHGTANPDNPAMTSVSELAFTTAFDIDARPSPVTFEFEFAQSKGTGFGRSVKCSLLNSSASEVFYVQVGDGALYVNSGVNQGAVGGGGNTGIATWDEDNDIVWSVTLEVETDGNVNWDVTRNLGSLNGTSSITSTEDIKTLQMNIDPDQWAGQGIYINDILVTEPAPAGSVFRFM